MGESTALKAVLRDVAAESSERMAVIILTRAILRDIDPEYIQSSGVAIKKALGILEEVIK